MVDFRREERRNTTHASNTYTEARLMLRGNGQPAKLCYGGHTFMETRVADAPRNDNVCRASL